MDNIEFVDGEYLSLGILPDGNLLITLTSEGWNRRAEIEQYRNKRGIGAALWRLFDWFYEELPNALFISDVSNWGHLSEAPAYTDCYNSDNNYDDSEEPDMAHFWYSPQYTIEDEIETLYSKGYMIWQYHQNY